MGKYAVAEPVVVAVVVAASETMMTVVTVAVVVGAAAAEAEVPAAAAVAVAGVFEIVVGVFVGADKVDKLFFCATARQLQECNPDPLVSQGSSCV